MVDSFLSAEAFGAKTSADIRVPSLMMLARRKEMSSGGANGAFCAQADVESAIMRNQRMASDSITNWRQKGSLKFGHQTRRHIQPPTIHARSEEHTSELQSPMYL